MKDQLGINSINSSISNFQTTYPKKTISLAPNTDLNTIVESGFYRLSTGHTNVPSETTANYSQLIVSRGEDTISQILIVLNDSSLYMRNGNPTEIGGSGKWNDWYQFLAVSTNDGRYCRYFEWTGTSGTDHVTIVKNLWSTVPIGIPFTARIRAGSETMCTGMKTTSDYGFFEIRGYSYTSVRCLVMKAGVWQDERNY